MDIRPAAPRLEALAGVWAVHQLLPTQLGRRRAATGPRALLLRLLWYAVLEAEVGARPRGRGPRPTGRRRGDAATRQLARQWLAGALDDQVAVPRALVCDALGLDAAALARVVRPRGVS